MTKFALVLIVIFSLYTNCFGQSIGGTLSGMPGREVRLFGFKGFEAYPISETMADQNGSFMLKYGFGDVGMGYLMGPDDSSFFVILSGEDTEIRGETFTVPQGIKITKGQNNLWFEQFATEHPRREQALSAWVYLKNMYSQDSLFARNADPRAAITTEINRIKNEDEAFLASLPVDSFVRMYLMTRKLVSSVSIIAQFRTEEIPGAIQALRELDLNDPRLYRSGLLSDVLESHVWLIENSGRPLDSVFVELNISVDAMVSQLSANTALLNEIMDYVFDLLEKRSLFTAAEHLALSLLNNHEDKLSDRLSDKLETYRAMRIGNTAPDFEFPDGTIRPEGITAGRLSEISSDYVLVVFAAGWCPNCQATIPELASKYAAWKQQGVEVVMVSLDDSRDSFGRFASGFPFISTTDLTGWDGPIVSAYHVQSIPSMFLLDRDRKILLRPNSVQHMDAWVDWHLVQGNPLR
jgi:peroxiredoxin